MGDIEWVKDTHSESLTPWHQDQPYLQLAGRQTCNLWIGIDAATGENGAVEWVKGSHDWGKVFEPEPFDGSAPKDVSRAASGYRISTTSAVSTTSSGSTPSPATASSATA